MTARRIARRAGLRYITSSDLSRGVRRLRKGRGYRYVTVRGCPVQDVQLLNRIRALVIPPAWTDVRICIHENGHLQATGTDARQRRQYLYHPKWRSVRDWQKFARLTTVAGYLPRIRQRVHRDLALAGLPQQKILAAIVRLLQQSLIRIGNVEYAKQNGCFGLTTLQNRHVQVDEASIWFHFTGKSRIEHAIHVKDAQLRRIVSACRSLPSQDLFAYVDDQRNVRDVTAASVNRYLRELSDGEVSAKDLRTWIGSVLALRELYDSPPAVSVKAAKKNVADAMERVARRMGNTPRVCRRSYVHPMVIQAYLESTLPPRPRFYRRLGVYSSTRLSLMERKLLELLKSAHGRKPPEETNSTS